MKHVLIYAIFRTEAWWTHVGRHMGVERVTVLTDSRGRGDRWVTDDFYAALERFEASGDPESALISADEIKDAIARCRVLRWLPPRKATAMILAMAEATDKALDELSPDAIVSLPIDSYVTDVLERRARARGIPFYELTAGALPGMSMLLYRGQLVTSREPPDPKHVETCIAEIADPAFAPVYVQKAKTFTRGKFHRAQLYFRLRAAAFQVYAAATRDRLNLRALDAQPWLGHKARARDVRIIDMIDADWRQRLEAFPKDRRVLFGLQMFPEASIDYWIDDLRLIRQEDMLLELARSLSAAGFAIAVKDHPLQFGFRQTALLEALRALPNVVIVPYEVSGNAMLALCGASVTATGTLGLQAALLGNASVAGRAYYVVDEDFITLRTWDDLADVSDRLLRAEPPEPLKARQERIIGHVLRGSFEGPFMSLFGFKASAPGEDPGRMGVELGRRLRLMGPEGEDWHGKALPRGGGGHPGSPLN
ncbi:MAG: hypothetical protein SWI22_08505 [Pseudomonadota bacterium]|nr:hypothetical protein [Pseudomonadota bacterium]